MNDARRMQVNMHIVELPEIAVIGKEGLSIPGFRITE